MTRLAEVTDKRAARENLLPCDLMLKLRFPSQSAAILTALNQRNRLGQGTSLSVGHECLESIASQLNPVPGDLDRVQPASFSLRSYGQHQLS